MVPAPAPYGVPNDPTQFGTQNVPTFAQVKSRQDGEAEAEVPPPEKVSVLETPIAKSHTTFYPQGKN